MLYKQLLKEFNKGVIVRNGTPNSDGSEHRRAILEQYTGTFQFDGALIGIKPVSSVVDGHLDLDWSVSALRYVDGQLLSIEVEFMTVSEGDAAYEVRRIIEGIMTTNDDIDLVLKESGFRVYQKEDEL